MQNSFPDIYNLLQRNPEFRDWNFNFAVKMSKEENEIDEIQKDEQTWQREIEDSFVKDDLIDDEWEKTVFIICNHSKKLIDSKICTKINNIWSHFIYYF